MTKEEQLQIYLARLELLTLEHLSEKDISVLEALQKALNFIEGEMQGY